MALTRLANRLDDQDLEDGGLTIRQPVSFDGAEKSFLRDRCSSGQASERQSGQTAISLRWLPRSGVFHGTRKTGLARHKAIRLTKASLERAVSRPKNGLPCFGALSGQLNLSIIQPHPRQVFSPFAVDDDSIDIFEHLISLSALIDAQSRSRQFNRRQRFPQTRPTAMFLWPSDP